MTTEILPVAPEPGAPVDGDAPPKKRRRGGIIALIVVGVLLLLGIIGAFVADAVAKQYARDYVRERIIQVLALPDDAEVEVDLGGGSILLQALAGRIDTIDVDVSELVFGPLVGSAQLSAEGVPLDENAPVESLGIRFVVDEADVAALAGNLSGLSLSGVELEAPAIVVASAFNIFGLELPIGMSIVPSASDGQLVFTPSAVSIGEQEFTADEVRANPIFAALAGPLLAQQSLCIADRLPEALTLTEAAVAGRELRLDIRGDGASLGGPGLSTPGTCAS